MCNAIRSVIPLILACLASHALAGTDFETSIQSGDEMRQQQRFDAALREFRSAYEQAASDTERGIALGKRAEVYAYDLGDYTSASEAAERALTLADAQPVARVTALKVLATCQIEADDNHAAATATLNRAAGLHGVDWAQPTILLMLGDCYRATGKYAEAVKTYGRVPHVPEVQKAVSAIAYLNAGIVYQYDLRQPDRAKAFFSQAVELHPGLRSEVSLHVGGRKASSGRPLILAHYMPWFTAKPFGDQWGWHWTMDHFDPEKQTDGKREIASKFYPLIGPYDSGDPDVLEYHLLLMKLAGIDGVIVDWYGLSDFRDYAILHRNTTRLLQQCERLKMKFVICYEDQTIPALVEGKRISAADRVSHAVKEIDWLSKYWFKSGSYVKLNGQPVLLSFGHAGLTNDQWSQCLSRLASPVAYFSQDICRDGALGGFGWPSPKVGMPQVDRFLAESKHWSQAIPAAFPRFDDIYREAQLNEGFPRLPDHNGRTLQDTLEKAIHSQAPIIQIATWNDWGEGTMIEPSLSLGYRDLEIVQEILRQQQQTTFTKDDLLLPHRLLRLRQAGKNREMADLAAEMISSGQLTTAKQMLSQEPEID